MAMRRGKELSWSWTICACLRRSLAFGRQVAGEGGHN
jgi:hypothetical protein